MSNEKSKDADGGATPPTDQEAGRLSDAAMEPIAASPDAPGATADGTSTPPADMTTGDAPDASDTQRADAFAVTDGPDAPRPNSDVDTAPAVAETWSDRVSDGIPDSDADRGPWASTRPDADDPAASTLADDPAPVADAEPRPVAYAAAPTSSAAVEDDHADEDHGSSTAAKALTFLVVLIAGAALGIWGAPKVAPMLPSGLAPVASWLTPGQSEIADLRTRLDEELAAMNARLGSIPDAAAIESQTQALVGSTTGSLSAELDALKQSLAQSDLTATSERLGALETSVQGAAAELAALKQQIEGGAVALGQDAAAGVDTYRAELDGLRAEVGQLSGAVSGFEQRLQEAMSAAEARISDADARAEQVQAEAAAAQDMSAAQAEAALVRAALATGQPFAEPLARLSESGTTVPAGLASAAGTGAPTLATLRQTFPDAAHQAIRASIQASAGEGIVARSTAFLQAQVASRSLTPQEGMTPDAVLSRVEDALRRDDLATALSEAAQLPSEAAAAMDGWLQGARLRADADAGLAELSASVPTLN